MLAFLGCGYLFVLGLQNVSGNAQNVSTYIAQQSTGKEMQPVIVDNLCYMLVNIEPLEAISVKFDYKMGPEGHILQTVFDDNFRRQGL